MEGEKTFSLVSDGLFALPYGRSLCAPFSHLTQTPESGPPLEPGYEYLQYLRIPTIQSTAVPAHQRPMLAKLDQLPHEPLPKRIHRLFKLDRWQDLELKQYFSIIPALWLATQFLERRPLLYFWRHLLGGHLAYDKRKGYYLAHNPVIHTPQADYWTQEFLTEVLPGLLKLSFRKLDGSQRNEDGRAFCSEARYQQYCKTNDSHPSFENFNAPRILLHSHFLYDIEHLSEHGSGDELKHVYLRIAISLCHELAHIAWKWRIGGDLYEPTPGRFVHDPLLTKHELRNEVGFSWELYTFGGDIHTIDHPGYFTTYYRPQSYYRDMKIPNTRIVVPRWWINIWFRKSTWDNFNDLFFSGQLRLPDEDESGYVFRQNKPEHGSRWTLWAHGKPRAFNCSMPSSAAFVLWNTVRPRQQAAQREENDHLVFKSSTSSYSTPRIWSAKRVCRRLHESPARTTSDSTRNSKAPRPQAGRRRAMTK